MRQDYSTYADGDSPTNATTPGSYFNMHRLHSRPYDSRSQFWNPPRFFCQEDTFTSVHNAVSKRGRENLRIPLHQGLRQTPVRNRLFVLRLPLRHGALLLRRNVFLTGHTVEPSRAIKGLEGPRQTIPSCNAEGAIILASCPLVRSVVTFWAGRLLLTGCTIYYAAKESGV